MDINLTKAEIVNKVMLEADPNKLASILTACRERRKPTKFLTALEAAGLLGVTKKTLYRYETVGLLHGVRTSKRRVRFDMEEVERVAREGVTVGGGERHD